MLRKKTLLKKIRQRLSALQSKRPVFGSINADLSKNPIQKEEKKIIIKRKKKEKKTRFYAQSTQIVVTHQT